MKLLIVDTYYAPYLKKLYDRGELARKTWAVQQSEHFAGGFGTSDAYSQGLGLLGVEAIEIVANSTLLQQTWAKEYQPELLGLKNPGEQLLAVLEAQIRWWKPTVLYVQDINWLPTDFIRHIKPMVKLVVGQNACPLAPDLDLSPYDLILTSLPHYVGRFRDMGVNASYFPIGFDERRLIKHTTEGERPYAITFVGGLGKYHSKGTQIMETIAQKHPLQVWGYGGEQLPENSVLRGRWQGEAWAEDMYGLLAKSEITLNRHINVAENYANNMRLYEATGMKACLMTDEKCNLASLFEPDHEIVTYSSSAEAISKLEELLKDPQTARKIAERGQKRTLKEHTYNKRMIELVDILGRWLKKTGEMPRKDSMHRQRILIACPASLSRKIPNKIRDALLTEHKGHEIVIISNTECKDPYLNGMKRWRVDNNEKNVNTFEACLNSFEPNQVIFLEGEKNERDAIWENNCRTKAESRKLICSTIGIA